MSKVWTIFKREVRQAFVAPNLYVMAGLFLAFSSVLFLNILTFFTQLSANASVREQFGYGSLNATMFVINNLFGFINFIMLFLVPVVTMRLLAEEKRDGTYDLMRAQPVREWEILLGKYLAGLAITGTLIVMTLLYPLATVYVGGGNWGVVEWKVVLSCYIGLGLVAAAFVAFGVFASAITENQIVASVVTFLGLLFLYLAGNLGAESSAWWAKALTHISIQFQSEKFTEGQIQVSNLAYFALFAGFFLFAAARVMESRRWGR